jgi:transposase InsO family protein
VIPTEYLLDNGSNFTSKAFSKNILKLDQKAIFAGVGAHHHNGIAERHIQMIMAIARSMLIHSAVHLPAVADTALADGCSTRCLHL